MVFVSWATAEQQLQGLDLLLAHLPDDEQAAQRAELLRAQAAGRFSLEHFLLATVADQPAGALLLLPQADGTTLMWPPVVPASDPEQAVENALFSACRDWLDNSDATLGQCLLDRDDVAEQRRLSRQGFPHLANLAILIRDLQAPLPFVGDSMSSIGFSAALESRFITCLEQTYEGSLDCPRMKGLRSGQEALKGHRQAGVFDPQRWQLFSMDGEDVGVLLLADHPEQKLCELVYLGVVPSARGRRIGEQMLLRGLHAVRDAGAAGMFLAVDEENRYAISLYERLWFVLASRKAVHARFIRDVKSG